MPAVGRAAAVLAVAAILFGSARLASRGPEHPDPGRGACQGAEWRGLVRDHVERYPVLEVADVYKLLHQATMGSEHYVPDREMAADWLSRELAEMGGGPEEPPVDPLGPSGGTVRIHLRPFVARGGDPARLLDAFVATGVLVEPRPELLECAVEAVLGSAVVDELPFAPDAFRAFVEERRSEGFGAVHHSDAFRRAYRPAYRVIAAELVADVMDPGGSEGGR